jgi:hypothetical protein
MLADRTNAAAHNLAHEVFYVTRFGHRGGNSLGDNADSALAGTSPASTATEPTVFRHIIIAF